MDLERRLDEVRQEGVQATKDVQASAQKVVRENARLKALLRHLNIADDVVDMWVPGDMGHLNEVVGFPTSAQVVAPATIVPVCAPPY